MISALDHVQIAIPPDRDQDARKYYGNLLGLIEIEKPKELQKRGGVWFSLPDGRQLHLGVEQDFRPSKKAHPCFVVKDHLDHLADLLTQHGFEVQFDSMIPSVQRLFSHDVFGNRIEFVKK